MDLTTNELVVRIVTIAPKERIDAFTSPALRQHVDELLASGATKIVFDLTDVPFLDSAGMAVLVSALKRARQADGDVKLVWPAADAARRILRLTKFDRVFEITETAPEAVARF